MHGQLEVVEYLLARGANVEATNRDGNTPLHVAAFLCREEVIKRLLDKGASPLRKNHRRETAIDVVSGEWSDDLAGFYKLIGNASNMKVDLDRIEQQRPRIAAMLEKQATKSAADSQEEDPTTSSDRTSGK